MALQAPGGEPVRLEELLSEGKLDKTDPNEISEEDWEEAKHWTLTVPLLL